MGEHTEIEFKTLLSESEFSDVIAYFKIAETQFFTQINYYFDTPDFRLRNKQMGLRIRTFASKAEMTIKKPQTVGLLEITDSLTLENAQQSIHCSSLPKTGDVFIQLVDLGIEVNQLQLIGSLKTKRAEINIPEGLLALDENWYNKCHDFELELEVEDAPSGQQSFSSLLNRLNIKEHFAGNKIQRMINILNIR